MPYSDTLTTDQFDFSESVPGRKSVVASYQVDDDRVLMADLNRPLLVALISKQTVTVTANSTETKSLDPEAPRAPFMDDPTDGSYTENGFITARFDKTGDGSKNSLVTDATAVKFDSFSGDEDFVREVTLTETAGSDTEVDIYTVVRSGFARLRRRSASDSNSVSDQLAKEDSVRWAFTNPDVPEGNREINWPNENSGVSGVIAPKQHVEIEFYDGSETVVAPGDGDSPTNLRINLPFQKRQVRDDEDPATLRREVRQSMVSSQD